LLNDGSVDFWAKYFKWKKVVHLFQRYSQGLTSDTWSLKFATLSQIKLLVPSTDEQSKIAGILSVIDAKIAAVSARTLNVQRFRRSLLEQILL
jgi:type I restriction enzyme S subunit